MPGNLNLVLRIRADLGNAKRGLKQLETNLRRVRRESKGIGAATRDLKQLETNLRGVRRESKGTGAATSGAAVSTNKLSNGARKAAGDMRQLETNLRGVRRESKGTGAATRDLKQLETNLRGVRRESKGTGAATSGAAVSTNKLSNGARKAAGDMRQLQRQSGSATRELGRMDIALAGLGGVLAAGAITGALSALRQIPATLITAGLQIEALEQRFNFAVGSFAEGANQLAFIRFEAERLGISFSAAARGYSDLLAAAKGTNITVSETRDVFLGIAEASAVLRLTQDQVAGALRAVQQIMSKGTLQAEEIRGQLGERLPGAFQIAARAMGVTTSELNKMLELGEVLSEDFLPKFGRQLREEFAQGVPDAVDSAAASFARLSNAVERLSQTIARSGLLDYVASLADGVSVAVNTLSGNLSLTDDLRNLLQVGEQALSGSGAPAFRNAVEDILIDMQFAGEAVSEELANQIRKLNVNVGKELLVPAITISPPDVEAPEQDAISRSQERENRRLNARILKQTQQHEDRILTLRGHRIALLTEMENRALEGIEQARSQGAISEIERQKAVAAVQERYALQRAKIEIDAETSIRNAAARTAQQAAENRRQELADLAVLELSLREPYERSVASIEAWRQATLAAFEESGLAAEIYAEVVEAVFQDRLSKAVEEFTEKQLRESRRWVDGARRALEDYENDATDAGANVERAITNSLSSMEDALVEFVQTGKLNFSSLVDSIIADFARIVIRQQILGPLSGALGGLFGGGVGANSGFSPSFHSGGVVGSGAQHLRAIPDAVFIGAPRYHRGGIAGLEDNEVPAILRRGETVRTPEQELMMRTATPSVEINFVNQGTPQREQSRQVRLDPRGLVIDVVLDDLANGGPIRAGVQRAVTPGG